MKRLHQIRRAHKHAKPHNQNPAWQNTHADLGYVLRCTDALLDLVADQQTKIDCLEKRPGDKIIMKEPQDKWDDVLNRVG